MRKADMLIEYIVSDIIGYIMEDNDIKMSDAMAILYGSTFFEKLCDVETGLYLDGSAYLYELLREEQMAKI